MIRVVFAAVPPCFLGARIAELGNIHKTAVGIGWDKCLMLSWGVAGSSVDEVGTPFSKRLTTSCHGSDDL